MYENYFFDLYGTLVDIRTDENKPLLWHSMADLYSLCGDFSDNSHSQTGTGKRLTPYKLMRKSQLFADRSYLVLKQVLERLDNILKANVCDAG